MNKNITVSLYGGLGNQLFQYATGLAVSNRANSPLVLDLSWFENVSNLPNTTVRQYALEPFVIKATVQKGNPLPQGITIPQRVLRKICRWLGIKSKNQVFTEKNFRFDPAVFDLTPPIRLNGYWQSHKYFDGIKNEVRDSLSGAGKLNAGSMAVMAEIVQSDAICAHVRRGDYVTNQNAADTHGLCDLNYYRQGIEITMQGMANPHCFVFSDDAEWVKANFKLEIPVTVVDVNGPDDAHQDLWLMAACKRFVIANSSLSWWGAYLGADERKIVVAPKKWFNDKKYDTTDLIPEDWQRI